MSAPAGRTARWAAIALGLILVFDVWYRAHTFAPILHDRWVGNLWPMLGKASEPLDCDESAYAYIGRRIVRGDVLYRDLTENKPPLGYWIYAATVALGGATELAIRLMPLPFVLATIALVWSIGLRLSGPVAACLAAAIYAVASTDPYLFGNGSNLEHFMNFFSVASLALLVHAVERRALWATLLSGAALGCAAMVKQVAVLPLLVYVPALVLRTSIEPEGAAGKWMRAAGLGAGFLAVWLIAISVLVARGGGADAYEDIIRYGGALATDTPPPPHAPAFLVRWIAGNADPRDGDLPWPFGKTTYYVWWGAGTWPLWIAAGPAVGWLLFGPSDARRRLVGIWTLCAWVEVALPRLFWQHYYLLPLPGIALSVAVLFAGAITRMREGHQQITRTIRLGWLAIALSILVALAETVRIQVRDYLLVDPVQLTVRYKGGGQWVVLREIGLALKQKARIWQDPRLFVWGWQSPLLFYSGMDSVTPHFFADPLLKAYAGTGHPLIQPRLARIMTDLKRQPPQLIFAGDPPFPELKAFLVERYRPVIDVGTGRRLPSTASGLGLWVLRTEFDRFEQAPPRPGTQTQAAASEPASSTMRR